MVIRLMGLFRVDGLCFPAPIFFYSVRWYFGSQNDTA